MPGSVANAAPTAVLPQSLCRAFVHAREYPALVNEYRNGESQRSVLAGNSRKQWRLAKRLTSSQLQALWHFYVARRGETEPFYFYDPYETVPKFTSDPTGQATQGRHTVRFATVWSQSAGAARSDTDFELAELA